MARRSAQEIAAGLEAHAARIRAEAARRLAVASDIGCELMWDAEKALRALAAYMGEDGREWTSVIDRLSAARTERWEKMQRIAAEPEAKR